MTREITRPSAEFEGADLGDERLNRRLAKLADCFAVAPAASFPKLTSSDGELEGVYRFLGNERTTPDKILLPHLVKAKERVGARPILAVHDTTELAFGGLAERAGLGRINEAGEKKGFFAHFALAVAADGSREPLGVVGLHTFVRRLRRAASRGGRELRMRWRSGRTSRCVSRRHCRGRCTSWTAKLTRMRSRTR